MSNGLPLPTYNESDFSMSYNSSPFTASINWKPSSPPIQICSGFAGLEPLEATRP